MKLGILVFSVLSLIVGGFLVFIGFVMSIGEPGHGGKMTLGLWLMGASFVGFIVGLLWTSRKK